VQGRCLCCHLEKFILLTCSLEEKCRSCAGKRARSSPSIVLSLSWHADRQHLAWPCNLYFPKCQGCAEAGMQLLQCSLDPVYPCLCCCEIRGFPAFLSVTSTGPLCPWVLFAFLSQEHVGETLLFISGCSLISHAVRLLLAPMAKINAAFAGVVCSRL